MIWPISAAKYPQVSGMCTWCVWSHRGDIGAVKGREGQGGPRTVLQQILYCVHRTFP